MPAFVDFAEWTPWVREFSLQIGTSAVLFGDPRVFLWVGANEATNRTERHNVRPSLNLLVSFVLCAVTTSAFVAQALYDFLSFECNGEEWVAVLLVACETIRPSESVRAHYGKSFENLRKWVAAPKGKLLEKTSLGQFLSFLSARGLSLVDVLPMCVPADGVPYSRAPRVPAIRPPTKVDSAPPVLAACQSALAVRVPPPTPQAA